jgi:hypothetical protein
MKQVGLFLFVLVITPLACTSASPNSADAAPGATTGTDADAAVLAACNTPGAPQCPTTPPGYCLEDIACSLDSLPEGLPCQGNETCAREIDPCPDWQDHVGGEEVDSDACACVEGHWACGLCVKGASGCAALEGGASSHPG